MQCFEFLFLARDWASDAAKLKHHFDEFIEDDIPIHVLIFPEGTTLNKESSEKGKSYAKKMDREYPLNGNVMLPRSAGFDTLLNALVHSKEKVNVKSPGISSTSTNNNNDEDDDDNKANTKVVDVYDVTIIYDEFSGEVPTWQMGFDRKIDTELPNCGKLFSGNIPKGRPTRVHFRKYRSDEVLQVGTEKFLDDLFVQKDEFIQSFVDWKGERKEEGKNISEDDADAGLIINPDRSVVILLVMFFIPVLCLLLIPMLIFIFPPTMFSLSVLKNMKMIANFARRNVNVQKVKFM